MIRRAAFFWAGSAGLFAALVLLALGAGQRTATVSAVSADEVKLDEGDNAACLCCHLDFQGEELTEKHLAHRITCRSCHGPSEPHRQDETLMTKPDLIYGRAEVVSFCKPCHQSHRNPDAVAAFQAQWLNRHRPENGRLIRNDAVCTDCHGQHTIPKRK